jgi:hypothetical protein
VKLPALTAALALFLAASGVGHAVKYGAANLPAAAAPSGAREDLWNGLDLAGWNVFLKDPSVDPKTVWSVSDGVLRLAGKPSGYLRTIKTYANYHLHVEWRWPANAVPKTNSGVFVHVRNADKIWPSGIECQLQATNAGQLVGTDTLIPGAPFIRNKYRSERKQPSSERPFGEWNAYDIDCVGATIEVSVNGVRQNRAEGIGATSGSIGLQMEGYPVDFRNVWLEPLPSP